MDGRRRIAQPLTWIARLRARPPTGGATPRARKRVAQSTAPMSASGFQRRIHRGWARMLRLQLPRGAGIAAAVIIMMAGLGYGAVKGDHVPAIVEAFKDARDQAANAAGFRIVALSVSGQRHLSREEILAVANVTGRTSLLFLDVASTRERLKTNPWIADATVLKLYPGELQIGITEREPFALWQRDRRVAVIADDGTVLETYAAPQLFKLPLDAALKSTPRSSWPCSAASRRSATRCALRSWSASAAGTCGCATDSTSDCPHPAPTRRSNVWSRSIASASFSPATSWRSI
jgi:cell division protein FtsQ